MTTQDRMARAQDYVLGLMDEHERERAERDMEVDAEFRDCVFVLAERMRRINREKPPAIPDGAWAEISERLAAMPHLAGRGGGGTPAAGPGLPRIVLGTARPPGRGAHSTGSRMGTAIAIGLATAFALGYLLGRFGATLP